MGDRFFDLWNRTASDEQAPARRRGAVVPSIPPADASPHDVPAKATKHLQDRSSRCTGKSYEALTRSRFAHDAMRAIDGIATHGCSACISDQRLQAHCNVAHFATRATEQALARLRVGWMIFPLTCLRRPRDLCQIGLTRLLGSPHQARSAPPSACFARYAGEVSGLPAPISVSGCSSTESCQPLAPAPLG
jgi:hypothetical protein